MCVAVYLSVLFLFGRVVPLMMPIRLNLYVLAMVILNTVLLPCVFAFSLRATRLIGDFSFSNRRERYLLLVVMVMGFGVCAWNFRGVELLFLFRRTMMALMVCVLLTALLDIFKHVDYTSAGMGAMTGVLWILVYAGYSRMLVPFCVALLLAGLVVSASMRLERHPLFDSAVSFSLAAVVSAVTILFS